METHKCLNDSSAQCANTLQHLKNCTIFTEHTISSMLLMDCDCSNVVRFHEVANTLYCKVNIMSKDMIIYHVIAVMLFIAVVWTQGILRGTW